VSVQSNDVAKSRSSCMPANCLEVGALDDRAVAINDDVS